MGRSIAMRHDRTIKLVPDFPMPEPVKGRGTTWAIEHRYTSFASETFDDGWGTIDQAVQEEYIPPATQIIEEPIQNIISGGTAFNGLVRNLK